MNVRERLHAVFRSVFGDHLRDIKPTDTAADIEGWDSIAHINLMFAVESEFGVEFTADELAGFDCVGELVAFLEEATAPG